MLDPVWDLFTRSVFPLPSTPGLFNLYDDRNEALDRPDAAAIRRENLRRYLACYVTLPRVLLLAEAPGPRGCRFSGVPFTSEAQLVDPDFPISGLPSGLDGIPHAEYSGKIYWRVLKPYWPHFFTWNSVPFHPHKPGRPLSVRNPTNREVLAWTDVLAEFVALMEPERILAIGRKAEFALSKIGAAHTYVRHPSQGGAALFEEGVRKAFADVVV
ncbi:MAG TPA: uracil-DNA glycosylase [Rhodothermales bacterium]|nr:uracil-DNA glycosylase [Rhodothermales bacterium]